MSAPRSPRAAAGLLHALLPLAEREEVLADFETEFARRVSVYGRHAARRWAWKQALGSVPWLLRRGWWRGMTGFEPHANRMRPGGPMFESWIMDLRYAFRRLRRRRVYAALSIVTLALGAGGTAAAFSVMRTLLLKPLPIAREADVGVFWFPYSWNESEFLYLRPSTFPGFARVAAYRPDNQTLEVPGTSLRLVEGMAASAEFFDVLGAAPMLGQTFRSGDDAAGAAPVSILSYELWRELGSDGAIVGKPLRLGGVSRTVIGVMPKSFWYPSPSTRIWNSVPLNPQSRSGRYALVGRVAPGTSIAGLDGPLRSIAAALGKQYQYPAQWDKTKSPAITPVREYLVGSVSPSLKAALAAMALILLMASANVAALMLGQLDAQATDIAVRAALGADRRRLAQQLLSESLVIGLLAGLAGAAFAAGGFTVLVRSLPLGNLAESAQLDWVVFGASMIAALVAAGLVAVIPGIALWRGSLHGTMATTRTGGVAGRGGRLESTLVVVQMALAVLLASGAGLLIRSVANLRAINPGVDIHGVALVTATMPTRLTAVERRTVILDVLPSLQSLPGVTSVAATQKVPLRGSGDNWGIGVKGRTDVGGTTAFRMVTRDYFTAMGMPLRRGRNFDASDRAGATRVSVINDALAAKYFPNEDPIGQVIQSFDEAGERIIGVVGNAAEARLTDPPVPARYVLIEQMPVALPAEVTYAIKMSTPQGAVAVLDMARAAIRRDGTQLALQGTTTLENVLQESLGPTGQVVTLLTILATLALVLGAVGVYGAMSHYVLRRTRDYGIVIALGQTPSRVVRQVVSRGTTLVLIGSAIGIAAALGATRILATLLYGVQAIDALSFAASVVVLLSVGMLAAALPARRASLTDPAIVLRHS